MLTMLWRPVAEMRPTATGGRPPWSRAGGPDPGFDEIERRFHHRVLTDPGLMDHGRWHGPGDYDAVIRLLDHVWDCPDDGAVNVTGFRCAACGQARGPAPPGRRRFRRDRDLAARATEAASGSDARPGL